jgi:hypothetical protein
MTQTTLARAPSPRRSPVRLTTAVLVVVAALACYGITLALRNPDVVPQVTVVNNASVPLDVDVRADPGGPALILDSVPAGASTTTLDVIDQGSTWIFRFSYGGIDGGTVTRSRAELAANGWRLVVPPEVGERIQSRSFLPAHR